MTGAEVSGKRGRTHQAGECEGNRQAAVLGASSGVRLGESDGGECG
jgi:hypothetical protein